MTATRPPGEIRWASRKQAAEYASVSVRTLDTWTASGALPVYRIAGDGGPAMLRIDLAEVDEMIRAGLTQPRKPRAKAATDGA